MKSEKSLRRWFLTITLLMSVSLLYGGYKVHVEAGKKSQYEENVRNRAQQINNRLCRELGDSGASAVPVDPVRFLRVCAEGQ